MKYSISICSNSRDRKRNCLLRGHAADVPLQRGQLRRPWSDLVAESLADLSDAEGNLLAHHVGHLDRGAGSVAHGPEGPGVCVFFACL